MTRVGKVTFKSTLVSKWVPRTVQELDAGVAEAATDILRRGVILAPVDKRNLVNSGRIERIYAGFYRIIFGSSKVPYAELRHRINRKNPQTIGYLAKAGNSVKRSDPRKYFRKRS